jgi:hypothetical protein
MLLANATTCAGQVYQDRGVRPQECLEVPRAGGDALHRIARAVAVLDIDVETGLAIVPWASAAKIP